MLFILYRQALKRILILVALLILHIIGAIERNRVKFKLFPNYVRKKCIKKYIIFSNDLFVTFDLYPDNCHPSFPGSVLIAASLFKEIYGRIPDLSFFDKKIPDGGVEKIDKVLKTYYNE